MHPAAAGRALHHPGLVVVVVVTALADGAVGALLLLQEARGAEREAVEVMGYVRDPARVASEALETILKDIWDR